MSAHDTETLAEVLGYDPPTDLAARVVDRDGDVWARHGDLWGCLTTSSAPQVWHDLVNVCGPLRLAARIVQARAGEGALRERIEALADEWGTEGPSLVTHAHGARDVHEGSTLERCADDLTAALTDTAGDPT